jgi:hypothetical protein
MGDNVLFHDWLGHHSRSVVLNLLDVDMASMNSFIQVTTDFGLIDLMGQVLFSRSGLLLWAVEQLRIRSDVGLAIIAHTIASPILTKILIPFARVCSTHTLDG